MRLFVKSLQAAALSAAALIATFILEGILLHVVEALQGTPMRLYPAALLATPIVSAIAGWRAGWRLNGLEALRRLNSKQRAFIGYSSLWVVSVGVFFSVFDPFGKYRWAEGEVVKFLFVLLGPIAFGRAALRVSSWVNSGAVTQPPQDAQRHTGREVPMPLIDGPPEALEAFLKKWAAMTDEERAEWGSP